MAAVETLEVRFQANIGSLSASISALIGKIGNLNAAAIGARANIGSIGVDASVGLVRLSDAAAASAKNQSKLTSKLKGTSRALRGVAASARAAQDGIGLHRLDEINLVGERAAQSRSGGGSGGGGSRSAASAMSSIDDIRWKLKKFIMTVGDACKDMIAGFSGAFKQVDDLTGGMLSGVGRTLAGAAKNIGQDFVQKLAEGLSGSDAPAGAGTNLVSRFISGITSGQPRIRTAASSAAAGAKFTGNYSEAYSAGADLSEGFANGITGKVSSIVSAAKKAAESAVSKLKSLLKIASPSKVACEIGGYFGEGFANGIRSTVGMAESGAAALSSAAVRAVRSADIPTDAIVGGSAAQGAANDMNIVVPLHVDGIKLGEAAIRGINRVTRSAGRVMLEI